MKKAVFEILNVLFIAIIFSACGENRGEETPVLPANEPEPKTSYGTFTFAVFGNTGFVTDDGHTFGNLISTVNEYGVDFSVNLGNSLPDGVPPSGVDALWESLDSDFQHFKAPVYPVVGKNDVFDFKSDVKYSERYGPTWYSFRREGTLFIVLNTEDDAYRTGFGINPWIGDEQLEWLWNCLKESKDDKSVVLFMNRPLWRDAPEVWSERLLPRLRAGKVNLIVTSFENGLFDWGTIDGIRAVSTGCSGPVELKSPGLFPHVLLVTVKGDKRVFRVLFADGTSRDGIWINRDEIADIAWISNNLDLPVLKAESSWKVSETVDIKLKNNFNLPISGTIDFTKYPDTRWTISPETLNFSVDPGVSKILHMGIRGFPPELGPIPKYSVTLQLGETTVYSSNSSLKLNIPRPRTGEVIPVSASIAENVPYTFDGKSLRIPVDVESIDTCGRLIIYREGESEIPICIHVSYLRDFKLGINEFIWDGCDLEGNTLIPGTLSYKVVIYNKKAPLTWVAGGPPNTDGTFFVERTLSGLIVKTHDESSILSFPVGATMSAPKSGEIKSFSDVLDGLPLTGFSPGEYDRIYLGTNAGITSVNLRKGKVTMNASFGDGGYVRLLNYRGRIIGKPFYHNGLVYVGIGGGSGSSPSIVLLDGETGKEISHISLGEYFGGYAEPPSIWVNDRGIYCAHPDDDHVMMLTRSGEVLWVNGPGDMIGDRDVDGRSYAYGIAADQYGFSYVNTPGYSARCGVLGPDGRALFRVIQVQLPGLRVSSVFPMIEGKSTDGLYFVTRGGDIPYVFHVPYTILAGKIVDAAEFLSN